MHLPSELGKIFSEDCFSNYPIVEIPQIFSDERGTIANIADGRLGDVAVIESKKSAIRANHYHETDWHLSYLVTGRMLYSWKSLQVREPANKIEIVE